jgi:hypothetical protein
MSEFRSRLKVLDDEALADVVADVLREQKRREPRKDPALMSDRDLEKWAADEIQRADAARAKAAQEQTDGR